MFLIFFFLLGLAVGSFLNCVIYRLEKKESIVSRRSYCPKCKKTLSWMELIPVMSFILQRGKCRHCKKPISLQYPLVESATGILFVLIFSFSAQGGPASGWLLSTFYFLVSSFLIVIFVYDLKHYIIPDQIIYPAIVVAGIWQLVFGIFIRDTSYEIPNTFLSAIIAGAFFLTIILASKGKWMGVGDVKLVVFMGLVLGWPKIFVALFLAFLIGAFVSVILMIVKKKTLKSEIPFGPFLALATIIAMFFGNVLASWYLNLFL